MYFLGTHNAKRGLGEFGTHMTLKIKGEQRKAANNLSNELVSVNDRTRIQWDSEKTKLNMSYKRIESCGELC